MKRPRIQDSLLMIADSVESGYSSVFTFAVKEKLNREERQKVATLIRELAYQLEPNSDLPVADLSDQQSLH